MKTDFREMASDHYRSIRVKITSDIVQEVADFDVWSRVDGDIGRSVWNQIWNCVSRHVADQCHELTAEYDRRLP